MGIDRPQAPVIISRKLSYVAKNQVMVEYCFIDHVKFRSNEPNWVILGLIFKNGEYPLVKRVYRVVSLVPFRQVKCFYTEQISRDLL